MRSFLENIRLICYAIVVALILRTLLFQPFIIPSGSMIPTLLVGDFLFVSKFSYGYSRYSFPFDLASFSGRVPGGAPRRGDVAVFKLPSDNKTDFIKRVIGLPGDSIQIIKGVPHINGIAVKQDRLADHVITHSDGTVQNVARYRETLPSGISYEILDWISNSYSDNTPVFPVPEGTYFVMGDNRDNSSDSRFRKVGYVPLENFVGRAEIIFFSFDSEAFARLSLFRVLASGNIVRWHRIADML